MEFKEFKEEILKRAKKADACNEQYKRAYRSENFNELLKVITDNFSFSCESKIIDCVLLEKVGQEVCNEGSLYFNTDCKDGYLIVENSTVTARGNSTVTARGNSTVTARENSTVTARENSTVTAWGNSYTLSFNAIEHKISEKAILRYYYEDKILVPKEIKIETY